MSTHVRLLGQPSIAHDGLSWEPVPDRRNAMMLYLAYAGGWVSRDDLLYLFWPDSEESKARTNLRQLVVAARALPFASDLHAERGRVRWSVETDVLELRRSLERRQVPAGSQWPAPLLDGFRLARTPEFDSWLELERASIRERCRAVLVDAVEAARRAGRWDDASRMVGGWLAREPLDEAMAREAMRVAQESGRHEEGLARFAALAASLDRELGLAPERMTLELVDALREEGSAPPNPAAIPSRPYGESKARSAWGSMRPSQGFFGRVAELARLSEELTIPGAVVTILGPGGMGKTRLALVAAERLARGFGDGAVVARLVGASDEADAGAEILSALGLEPHPSRPLTDQVIDALEPLEALVVLDNAEAVAGLDALVETLRQRAAGVSWLVTSRRLVGVSGESVLELHGLQVSVGSGSTGSRDSEAFELFSSLARRAGCELDPRLDGDAVLRVCHAAAGMPLALELAAGWLRVLSVARIADELEAGIDLLTAADPDAGERHASMAAVFESSWNALTGLEQGTLVSLAACRGGFTEEAARAVANAGRPLLLGLRNRSFLSLDHEGRFYQHPLLEAWLRSKAETDPDAFAQAKVRHARYYCEYLTKWEDLAHTGLEAESERALSAEHPNLEAAWLHALELGWWEYLKKGGATLGLSYLGVGRPFTWNELLRAAQARVPPDSSTWALLEVHESSMDEFAGRHQEAYDRRARAVDILRATDDEHSLAWALLLFAESARSFGKPMEARTALTEARAIFQELDEPNLLGMVLLHLLNSADDQDDFLAYHRAGTEVWHRTGHAPQLWAATLSHASFIADVNGEYAEALKHATEARDWFIGQAVVMLDAAEASALCGRLHLSMGDLDAASTATEDALRLWPSVREVFRLGEPQLLAQLARVLYVRGDLAGASAVVAPGAPAGSTLEGLLLRCVLARARGEPDAALALAQRALEATHEADASGRRVRIGRVRALTLMAEFAVEAGDVSAARIAVHEAVSLAARWRYLPSLLRACSAAVPLLPTPLGSEVAAWVSGHGAAEYEVRRSLPRVGGEGLAMGRSQPSDAAAEFTRKVEEALRG